MAEFEIHDMDDKSQYYVSVCSHCNESDETDLRGKDRLSWLLGMREAGLITKVAMVGGETVGFIHLEPIEISTWGVFGKDLMVIPCLDVNKEWKGKGLGKELVQEAAEEAEDRGAKGLVVLAYSGNFPFMPVDFFLKMGFREMDKRKVISVGESGLLDDEVLLVLPFGENYEPPHFYQPKLDFHPVKDMVVVDLFSNPFCLTSITETERVREIVKEFGKTVVLIEHPAEDRNILNESQIPRGIFVNGKEIGWGWAAPKDGIREAISKEIEKGTL
jgi:predicted N-acetyltransferase YhbS